MKKNKWCKWCDQVESLCGNEETENPCLLCTTIVNKLQSYRDWLAKWIKNCRKYPTKISNEQLKIFKMCAKNLMKIQK